VAPIGHELEFGTCPRVEEHAGDVTPEPAPPVQADALLGLSFITPGDQLLEIIGRHWIAKFSEHEAY
jgi:hypothetical protein